MKKTIIALMLSAGVISSAFASGYAESSFTTENYQTNVMSSIEYINNISTFDESKYPQAQVSSDDFTKLMEADLAFNQGSYAIAANNYNELAKKYDDPRLILKAINSYQHNLVTTNDYENLNSLIKLLTVKAPQSSAAQLYSVTLNLYSSRISAAIDNINDLIKTNKSQARTVLLAIATQVSEKNYPISADDFNKFADKISNKFDEYPEGLLLASICYSNSGNLAKLNSTMTEIYKKYPTWDMPIFWNAGILANNNNVNILDGFIQQQMKERQNASMGLQNLYVTVLMKVGKLNDASQYIINSTAYKTGEPAMLVNKAVIDYKQGNNDIAQSELQSALNKKYDLNGAVEFALGSISLLNNDYNTAIAYFKTSTTDNPKLYSLSGVGLLNAYVAQKNYAAIDKYIESSASLSGKPDERKLLINRLAIYAQLQQYDYAYKIADKYKKKYAKDSSFMYLYTSLTGLSGRNDQAVTLYKQYIAKNPKDPSGYNDLAFILADKKGQAVEALKYANKANELQPNDAAILDTLGWVNFKLKNYTEAESYLSKAYLINQDNDIAAHLKEVYIAEGKADYAKSIVVLSAKEKQQEISKQLLDQSMMILMYYQFGGNLK